MENRVKDLPVRRGEAKGHIHGAIGMGTTTKEASALLLHLCLGISSSRAQAQRTEAAARGLLTQKRFSLSTQELPSTYPSHLFAALTHSGCVDGSRDWKYLEGTGRAEVGGLRGPELLFPPPPSPPSPPCGNEPAASPALLFPQPFGAGDNRLRATEGLEQEERPPVA